MTTGSHLSRTFYSIFDRNFAKRESPWTSSLNCVEIAQPYSHFVTTNINKSYYSSIRRSVCQYGWRLVCTIIKKFESVKIFERLIEINSTLGDNYHHALFACWVRDTVFWTASIIIKTRLDIASFLNHRLLFIYST